MKTAYQQQHSSRLKSILAAVPKTAPAALRDFVESFYEKATVSDLERMDAKRAVAVARSALEFMQTRKGSDPKIRIFSPNLKVHGYEGRHTVVELLNNDMPFLVDSLSLELNRQGFIIKETIHPIIKCVRDAKGALVSLAKNHKKTSAESLIHFEIAGSLEAAESELLQQSLELTLANIRAAVQDWRAITERAEDSIAKLKEAEKHFGKAEVLEAQDFLRWLLNRNFVFLGYAEYDFFDSKGREKLTVAEDSKLGVLKLASQDEQVPQGLETLPEQSRHFLLVPQIIEITKANRRSLVHRSVPMDYIGLKRFDAKGKVIGEARFLGLFTSHVYYQSASEIPLARRKIFETLSRAAFDPTSHDGKSLMAILEFLPRDEIFQMSDDDLFDTSMGILALEAKPAVRVFVRRDAFERFISAMVFVPKDRFSTELRIHIQSVMEKAFGGSISAFYTQITDSPLARLHLIIKTTPGEIPDVDVLKLKTQVSKLAYQWGDLLLDALEAGHGLQKAEKLHRSYFNAFPQSYISRYEANSAAFDIDKIDEALATGLMSLELWQYKAEDPSFVHLKIYNPNDEIALSDILPLLENAGFRAIEEQPFHITPLGKNPVWIRDFKLQASAEVLAQLPIIKPMLEDALIKAWRGEIENDRFNALVLKAGLSPRQVVAVRAYAKYLKQTGFTYSQATIEQALNQHPRISALLINLFEARFNPAEKQRDAKQKLLLETIEAQLADVTNVVEDRVLRRFAELIAATLRTNYYQTDKSGAPKPVLSFKFDSAKVPELPLPRPFAEIFVYGTRVEGIHLRGGKVARGGLRWSDRHEDFRTEILSLMKAQMVKNSVIVPVGSKGGFVVKHPPATRDAYMQEGVACYQAYLRGLLDITDNIVAGKVVAPAATVRHDEDDPYLVVAADKGTASFSDIANGVSGEYGFWLSDAFASGGSAGYDHKKMAITARGAWVSVTRHFREMGVDIAKQSFTAVGIGDMAGDVFGNGMLLSDKMQLVAAFNHMHIFIDPTPNTKTSFTERKRLFELPRSSWADYNTKLISAGGGIFERSAKSIALSKEAQSALGISKGNITPDELIRAILLAPVDLLWNGGIGTYVKATDETHEQAGDRTNNAVRVNGRDLRAKIVGEGGNLGFTQKGRIEFAREGGRINTDAIDNSGGVDCSDHEVNIKIAFSQEMSKKRLTLEKRNKLLASMTEEVGRLVLKDNFLQTQALSVAQTRGFALLESQTRLMRALERQDLLDRGVEFLPGDKLLADMRTNRQSLTRPELAVLMAYSKMVLYRDLLASSLPDEEYCKADLKRYFPKLMQKDFLPAIDAHPLKREIIATVVTNSLVNRAGITFYFDIIEDVGVSPRDVAAAYIIARDAFDMRGIWKAMEEMTGVISSDIQAEIHANLDRFLGRVTLWLLRNQPLPLDMGKLAAELFPQVAQVEKIKASLHSEATKHAADKLSTHLQENGVPKALAETVANLEIMESAFDIIAVSLKSKLPMARVGKLYFELGKQLRLGWLRRSASQISGVSHWERLALQALVGDVYDEQRRLTINALAQGKSEPQAWAERNREHIVRIHSFIDDLKTGDTIDLPRLTVALKHIRALG